MGAILPLEAMPFHVSKAEFAELVKTALAGLPPHFAKYLEEVAIEIRDRIEFIGHFGTSGSLAKLRW